MITVSCDECKQKMVNNVLEHIPSCTANMFKPVPHYDFLKPPSTVISFDTPEEQAEWLRKLSSGSGEHPTSRKLAKESNIKGIKE